MLFSYKVNNEVTIIKLSRNRPGQAQRFQQVKVPRFLDNGTRRW